MLKISQNQSTKQSKTEVGLSGFLLCYTLSQYMRSLEIKPMTLATGMQKIKNFGIYWKYEKMYI